MTYNFSVLLTVAQTSIYTSKAERLFEEEERNAIVDFLSSNPQSGQIVRGTGGIRKLRWAREGSGKSGGVRIIYYYHSERMPLWLLTLYAKNEQSDLTSDQRRILSSLIATLIQGAGL